MLIFLTGKSNPDYINNLTESLAHFFQLASLEKVVTKLRQKKQAAVKVRKKTEKQFKESRSFARRSASSLASIERKIESGREELSEINEILTQKLAQKESIGRLITAAQERLAKETDEKTSAEQEIEFSDNPEEKQYAESRLRSITSRIQELKDEIKSRQKTAQRIEDEIKQKMNIKSKTSGKIQKQVKTKPLIKENIKKGKKATEKLAKQLSSKSKTEEIAKKSLDKASTKLRELLAKKRKAKKKTTRKPAKKTPAKRKTTKRKPAKKSRKPSRR